MNAFFSTDFFRSLKNFEEMYIFVYSYQCVQRLRPQAIIGKSWDDFDIIYTIKLGVKTFSSVSGS